MGQRQALGHADHCRLAGVVGQVSPASNLAGHRCQADDDPTLLCDHRRQHGLGREEHGLGVDIHDRVPVFLGDVECRRRAIDAGVVHKCINPAELGECPLDHRTEIIAGRDIRLHHKRTTAQATQFRRGALRVRPSAAAGAKLAKQRGI